MNAQTQDRTRAFHFDRSLNLGAVIQLIVLLVALWAGFSDMRARLTRLEDRVMPMWELFLSERR